MTSGKASANPTARAAMTRHLDAIRRARVDHRYAYDSDALLDDKLGFMAANCARVLDVGQSSRQRGSLFSPERIDTMDINLGDGPSGREVLKSLRAIPAYRKVPVAALTAYALPGEREDFLKAGFNAYLSKPFSEDALLKLLAQLLKT